MRALVNIFILECKLLLREPTSFLFILVFPTLMALLVGLQGTSGDTQAATNQVLSFLGISPMVFGLMSFPITFVSYRERGMLRRLRVTPLSPLVYLLAQGCVGLVMTALGGLLLVVVTKLVLNITLPLHPGAVGIAFILGTLAFIAIGLLMGSIMPTTRTLQILSTLLFAFMIFSLFVSSNPNASPVVQQIAQWIPISHMMRLVTHFWFGSSWEGYWINAIVLLLTMIICLLIASRLFRWE